MSHSDIPTAPEPVRRYTYPEQEEDWEALATRAAGTDTATLQSWNAHLAMRPEPFLLTLTDIIFIEPPKPLADAS